MTKPTGGPAFPRPKSPKGEYTDSEVPGAQTGMTLRDYFAAKALPGLMGRSWSPLTGDELVSQWAISAYALADAMLTERAK
jgi:hypothetical protein